MAYRQVTTAIFNTNTGLTINEDELDQLDTRIGVIEAIVPSQVVLRDGTNNMTGNLDLNNYKIENLSLATTGTDALSRDAGDTRYVELAGDTMTGDLGMSSKKITDLGDATLSTDAMNQQSADARYVELAGDTMTGKLTVNYGPTSGDTSFDIGNTFGIWMRNSTNSSYILNNLLYSGIWEHKEAGYASMITLESNGIIKFFHSDTTTAGGSASFTQLFNMGTSSNKSLVSLDMNGQKITNLADPTVETDALNRRIGDGRYIYKDQDDTSTGSLHLDGALGGSTTIPDTMKLRVGDTFGILPYTNGANYLINNGYLNSGWKRISTGYSNLMIFETDGTIQFYHGGYGTAGSAITFTQRLGIEDTKLDSHVALDMFSNQINNLAAGSSSADALRYDQVVGVYLPLAGGTMSGAINMGLNDLTSAGSITSSSLSTGSIQSGSYEGDGIFNEIFPNDDIVFTKIDGATSKLISWDSNAVHVTGQRDFSIVHDSSQNLVIRGASDASLLTINDTSITSTKPIDLSNQDITSVNDIYLDADSLTYIYSATNGSLFIKGQGTGGTVGFSHSDGRIWLTSGQAASTAVQIQASNASGGIDMQIGVSSVLALTASAITASQDLVMGSNDITGVNEVSNTGRLTLSSSQVSTEAIILNSSDASGGVKMQVNSTDIVSVTSSLITFSQDVNITDNLSGGTTELQLYNTSNTASSNSLLDIRVGGSVAGDPYMAFDIDGVGGYAIGIDNSDSDKFKITRGGPPTMASTSALEITTGGLVTIPIIASGFKTSSSSEFYSVTENSGTGDAFHYITAGGTSGDAYIRFYTGVNWCIGVDYNDSDKLKIGNNTSPSTGNTAITIDTNENTFLSGQLDMGNNSIVDISNVEINTDKTIKFQDGTGTNTCGIYWSDINHAIFCHRTSNIMYWKEYGTHVWQTLGTNTRMQLSSSGLLIGNPTGGFKGNGTLNCSAAYDDNTLLTCFPFLKYFDGSIDVEAYNAKFPNVTYEEGYWDPEDEEEHAPEKEKTRTITRVREHEGIPKFLAKCDSEYNPLDVDCYWKHIEDKRHLPAMPNPDKWNDDNQASTGGYIARLIETVECQAVHIHQLNERLKILEGKLNI